MKTFWVAVAVAVMLTCICMEESSAVPVTEVPDEEEPMSYGYPLTEHDEPSDDSWMMPYSPRARRRRRKCKFCCNCCSNICQTCCTRRF
ncbi:hepcidin-like [Trematomus bernacchii]|uniref:hepcidin-like n=1 Tax=Trematomus bernacchii TaxID=40690 RepID=UPI00146E8A05|nr:hepcidin-like [Trematomus bernacchii]